MYINPTSDAPLALTLTNCTFIDNSITGAGIAPRGGAIGISLDGDNNADGSIVIDGCKFLDNVISNEGAGNFYHQRSSVRTSSSLLF